MKFNLEGKGPPLYRCSEGSSSPSMIHPLSWQTAVTLFADPVSVEALAVMKPKTLFSRVDTTSSAHTRSNEVEIGVPARC